MPAVRDQVVTRYKPLKMPTYWAGLNAILTARMDKNGQINSVEISYPRDAVKRICATGVCMIRD